MNWVAIDGGQSAVRVRTSATDTISQGGGFSHGPDRIGNLIADLGAALASADLPDPVDVVAMGHTGMPVLDDERRSVATALLERTGAAEVRMAADWVTSHAGALSGRPGVVIAAGTGSVCLGIDAAGTVARVDGWGHLIGDGGSSYAVGRHGLAAATADLDGRGPATGLRAAAEAYLGDELIPGLSRLHAQAGRVDLIARFTPAVLDCARAGDQVAGVIIDRVVTELVNTVGAACARLTDDSALEISYTGGLFAARDLITDPFLDRVRASRPGWTVTPPEGGALDGAIRLAGQPIGHYRDLVFVARKEK